MKRIFSLVCFFTLGSLFSLTFADQVFYVMQNGNDANSGTSQAAAFKTLAKAVSVVEYAEPATIYLEEDTIFDSPANVQLGEGRTLTLIGKNTTVKSGDNPYLGNRILTFNVNTDVKIKGITFRNGCTRSGIPGGAIFFEGNKLEIDSCSFIENEANSSGGALASRGKELVITNSVFYKNRAFSGYGYGGVLWHSGPYPATEDPGSLVIRNCSFTENIAKDDTKGDVISLGHAYRATEDRTSPGDGKIFNGYTNVNYLEITNCLFKDNINEAASAGVSVGPAAVWLVNVRYDLVANIINNTFYKAKALSFGGFYLDEVCRLVNNVFYNKDAYVIKSAGTYDERNPFIAYNNVVVGEMIKVDDPSFTAEKETYGNQIFENTKYADIKLATVAKNDDAYVYYLPITDESSVLVNNGLSSTAGKEGFDKEYIPATDMRGVAVQGVKDIGAFEFIITNTGIPNVDAKSLFTIGRSGDNAVVKNNTGKILDLQIRLLDGRTVYRANLTNELTIGRSELEVAGGVLIFTVTDGKAVHSKKVILF